VAQEASWQDQVAVFVKGTAGDNFGAWGPDLVANPGDPNSASNPNYGYQGAPQTGSKVASTIARDAAAWEAGTAVSGTGTTSGGTTATEDSLNANPLDLFGIPSTVAGGAASATAGLVLPFLAKAILVSAGLALVVLAGWKAASPTLKRGADDAAQLAPLAAA
jgi:hypothetical protein